MGHDSENTRGFGACIAATIAATLDRTARRAACAMVATVLACSAPCARAAVVQDMPVHVLSQQVLGAMPRLLKPSVMMTFADVDAIEQFMSLPGRLGTIRLSLETLLTESTSLADYRYRLAEEAAGLRHLTPRGPVIVLTFTRMPRWLASSSDERLTGESGYTVREASPPRSLALLEQLAFATVQEINVNLGLDVLYEFWNEPESSIFWGGTQEQLLQAYAAFAAGARRADPKARVGGLAGGWNEYHGGGPIAAGSLLKAFIDRTGGTPRLPLDFISWHNYPKHPNEGWDGADRIREWLVARGWPSTMPQVVSEWNQWISFPAPFEPSRDELPGAAFLLASLHEMRVHGVSMQTICALQDFHDPAPGSAFPGDLGLLTRSPTLKKAGFHAMNMLAMLDGQQRVAVAISGVDAVAQGVDALATAGPRKLSVLLSRYAPPFQVFTKSLRRAGIVRRSQIPLTDAQLLAFAKHELELDPSVLPANLLLALTNARASMDQARDRLADEVRVTLRVDGALPATPYRVYQIDDDHLNPARAYRQVRARLGSHASALAAARSQQDFLPGWTGAGPTLSLRLPRYAAVLVVFDTPV